MFYPHWEVPILGGGLVIGLVATIHVLFAHFAVGAGLFVAITEQRIANGDNPLLKDFLKRFAKFLLLFSFVAGALTGVGIWFSIGLASPRATSMLIHNYVWGWAAEWVLFLVEIVAGYCYFYGFEKLPDSRRRALAWIYAVASWGSLVIINGILTFMLTPGDWLENQYFWSGFFNPTYWPSLILRTISCLSLAGIFVAVVVNGCGKYTREEATKIINHAAWFIAPLVLMVPAAAWFFYAVPPQSLQLLKGGAIAMQLFFAGGMAASTLVGLYAFIGLIWRKRYVNMETAILLVAIAFIATANMEMVREGIRKPFLIYDYLYSNGWTVDEREKVDTEGILAQNPWVVPEGVELTALPQTELGHLVYKAQCSQCHVLGGVNDVTHLVATWDESLMRKNVNHIDKLKPFMPPLVGTPEEKEALVQFLLTLNGKHGNAIARVDSERDAETLN